MPIQMVSFYQPEKPGSSLKLLVHFIQRIFL